MRFATPGYLLSSLRDDDIVNILAYHAFVMKGAGLTDPSILVISALAAYLLWAGRKEFLGLIPGTSAAGPRSS